MNPQKKIAKEIEEIFVTQLKKDEKKSQFLKSLQEAYEADRWGHYER